MKSNSSTRMVSIIIPVYNEELFITQCLSSLQKQTLRPMEIIVIDDGSYDNSKSKISSFIKSQKNNQNVNIFLLEQKHKGPGIARNFGATRATGDILVFVDADMTFDIDFSKRLTEPIVKGETNGTFTKDEYVSNLYNVWARCWNFNQGIITNRRIPDDYPDTAPVFRAIKAHEFRRVGGFDEIGYTDDWTLSRKLGYKATYVTGAICYHSNPETLRQVFNQARWIGKNEFLTKNLTNQLLNLIRFSPPVSFFFSIIGAFSYKELRFIIFKTVYDTGIWISVLLSFLGERRYR